MEEPEQLSSIYHDIQTAISRDLSLDILPLHHRSVRKPLGAVLKSCSITYNTSFTKVVNILYENRYSSTAGYSNIDLYNIT